MDSRDQFVTDVFPAELAEIAERRRRLGLSAAPNAAAGPSVEHGLAGLALSGGGIRSSALSLGVLQAFAARGLLRGVDYLSTVSGGGLIGSCLSVLLDSPAASTDDSRFPLAFTSGTIERPAVRYLRNHDQYLASPGAFGAFRLPAVVLRGMVGTLAMLVPVLIVAVQATEFLFVLFDWWGLDRVRMIPLAAAGAFALLAILQPVLLRLFPGYFTWAWRNRYEQLLSGALFAIVLVIAAVPWFLLVHQALDRGWGDARHVLDLALWLFCVAAGLIVLLTAAGTVSSGARALASRVALLGLGALGYAIVFGIYLLLTLYHASSAQLWDGAGEWPFIAAGVLGWLYLILFANPNLTSQHAFFRDRMSRAFLFRVTNDGGIEPQDAIKLSDLNRPETTAPYHLINSTLNLQGAPNLQLAGRDADFFLFSRHHVGSPTTGYCRTEDLERRDRHLNLGTAMAISGAGVAPNMGTDTVGSLVFLLALLDLRLDYWSPNPERARRLRRAPWRAPGADFLLKEALGRLTASGAYVNVSDGGQIENLGVYELLRRRCRTIVAIDAGQDPPMTCASLADVIRYARIDLGVDINIDPRPLRLDASGFSAAHWVAGDIHYDARETGRLLYVKASVTGDEPASVLEYRALHPAFPQESSANQFFSEAQFEAYRALGWHIAETLSM